MEMELTPQSLQLFSSNKEMRQRFVEQVIFGVEVGQVNPIELHLQLKCMEEIIKSIKSDKWFNYFLLEESEKHGKAFDKYNAKFSIKETGVKYDYSQCNDSILIELQEKQELLDNEVKERQAFLKTLPVHGLDIIDFNGEVLKVFPPSKSSTTSVTVTLK